MARGQKPARSIVSDYRRAHGWGWSGRASSLRGTDLPKLIPVAENRRGMRAPDPGVPRGESCRRAGPRGEAARQRSESGVGSMDDSRFDSLVMSLANPAPRRTAVQSLGGAALALLAALGV